MWLRLISASREEDNATEATMSALAVYSVSQGRELGGGKGRDDIAGEMIRSLCPSQPPSINNSDQELLIEKLVVHGVLKAFILFIFHAT